MIIRMREQLKSLIERKICANREWSLNKKNLLRYFHAVYVFEKASLRFTLLRLHHDDFLTKHYDSKKTLTLLERKFYWQRMRANIDVYVQECEVCQRTKTSRHRFYDELVSLLVFIRFWVEIFMNFITKLFASRHENDVYDFIFVIVDKYTKMFFYILVKSTWSIENLIDVLFEKVFLYFENVKSIVSNKDNLFTSDFWSTLCYRTRIKRKLNIVFHSQIDEQIER